MRHIVLFLFVWLWASSAYAANIAILRPAGTSPALTEALYRLQGELLALGLHVEVVARPAEGAVGSAPLRDWLEQRAAERGTDAIIDVVGDRAPTGVDVWIFQRSPARSTVTRVELEPNVESAAETLAIRAIEVLRSNFLEIDLAARQRSGLDADRPRPEEPAKPPGDRGERHQSERLGLEAGAGVLTSLDGVAPAIMPLVRFGWALNSWLVMQATLSGLGTRPTLETADGSTRVAQQYGILGLCYCPSSDSGLRPILSLSAGALRTTLDGQADAPHVGHSVEQWSFLVEGSLGAHLRLSGPFYLALASHVQLAEPYVAIHLADEVVGTTGRPNLLVTLTVGAWL